MSGDRENTPCENGVLPADWDMVQFVDAVTIKNGQVDPRIAPYDTMLHVGSKDIESGSGRFLDLKTNRELKVSSGNYHFTSEDVLYSKIRPYLNKVALPDFEGTCSADMYPLRSPDYDREFLFFYLLGDGFLKAAMSFQDRTGIPKINRSQLGSISLPLPPLPEQKKIAHILSTVQQAIEAQERIIQTTTELKKALMHKLFTEGLRGEPQKQTEIGPVPKSWEIESVGEYCDILNGYAFKSEDYVTTGGIPNFRVVNINWDGTISMDDTKFLPNSFANSHEKYLLNDGDILFVMVGATRGKLAQIPASILPALMNQNMWRIVPKREGVDRDYLYYHLQRSIVALLKEDDDQARGFFKKSDFKNIPLALPTIEEQTEIRQALQTVESKLAGHAAKITQLQDLFRTFLHELMTAKIRVHELQCHHY